jgi:hypothetical protein
MENEIVIETRDSDCNFEPERQRLVAPTISRSDVDYSHVAPTRRSFDAYRSERARWRRRLAAKDQLVELLHLRLVELRHEMTVAI